MTLNKTFSLTGFGSCLRDQVGWCMGDCVPQNYLFNFCCILSGLGLRTKSDQVWNKSQNKKNKDLVERLKQIHIHLKI